MRATTAVPDERVADADPDRDPRRLLDVTGLSVSLGQRPRTRILHSVDLQVRRGEIVGLIGETGSGKTTLARAVLGLAAPDEGRIVVDGVDTTALGHRRRRQLRRSGALQYVFQDPLRSLDPDLTCAASIGEPLAIRGEHAEQVRAVVERTAALVQLDPGLLDRHPSELSGGQRQRVAIARAMAPEPRLLLCDEPVSALDASTRARILRLFVDLRDEKDLGILLITHDLATLAGLADRVVVLYGGRVVEAGDASRLLTAPEHPYTRLLVASIPTIDGPTTSVAERRRLRDEVAALTA
jgi:ABC-type glutathione transport system ATPase component